MLFARLAGEPHRGFDHPPHIGRSQAIDQRVPRVDLEQQPEVAGRHLLTVDDIGGGRSTVRRGQVGDHLVTVEIEVDPRVGRPTLRAPEHATVERPRGRPVEDRDREVETGSGHAAQSDDCPPVPHQLAVSCSPSIDPRGCISSKVRL